MFLNQSFDVEISGLGNLPNIDYRGWIFTTSV